MGLKYDILVAIEEGGRAKASVPSVPGCHASAESILALVDRIPEAIAECLGTTSDGIEIGKIRSAEEMRPKIDKLFHLDWTGNRVQIHEYIYLSGAHSVYAATISQVLSGIGIGLGYGTLEFEFKNDDGFVRYGVRTDSIIYVNFDGEGRIWIMESLDRGAFRQSLIINHPTGSASEQ